MSAQEDRVAWTRTQSISKSVDPASHSMHSRNVHIRTICPYISALFGAQEPCIAKRVSSEDVRDGSAICATTYRQSHATSTHDVRKKRKWRPLVAPTPPYDSWGPAKGERAPPAGSACGCPSTSSPHPLPVGNVGHWAGVGGLEVDRYPQALPAGGALHSLAGPHEAGRMGVWEPPMVHSQRVAQVLDELARQAGTALGAGGHDLVALAQPLGDQVRE
ncbi:hypothetical protein MRB53_037721 [Persea americana]|nr:hypothetical protein MRB53_037721 [Persea americana]